jgi:hypothetical protein
VRAAWGRKNRRISSSISARRFAAARAARRTYRPMKALAGSRR